MVHIVSGSLKEYDWGVVDGLARWHGPTGAPQAELWFGIHPSGPTPVVSGPDAGRILAEFDEHQGMPLVKLLSAGSPLSIQVHPDARLAQRGWASGSPLYADDAEKSEMLVALEPFDVHAGWRDADEAARLLAEAGAPRDVVDIVRAGDPVASVRRLLAVTPADRAAIARHLVDAAIRCGWTQPALVALERVVAAFPGDPGVLVSVLLDHDVLRPGEAVAVSAGIVHSYVGGLGVEVMTSSDNVLRLGLTGKPVAVDEALEAVAVDVRPQRLESSRGATLSPEGMPFDVTITSAPADLASGRHRLVLALEGAVRIDGGPGAGDVVSEGRAAVWSPGEPAARVVPAGRAIVVTG
jgi:mannose-6-phosphate isomerase